MSEQNLTKTAVLLEEKIAHATLTRRLELQPQFSAVMARLKAEGQPVPARLRRLDAILVDEVIEARFDNMPV